MAQHAEVHQFAPSDLYKSPTALLAQSSAGVRKHSFVWCRLADFLPYQSTYIKFSRISLPGIVSSSNAPMEHCRKLSRLYYHLRELFWISLKRSVKTANRNIILAMITNESDRIVDVRDN